MMRRAWPALLLTFLAFAGCLGADEAPADDGVETMEAQDATESDPSVLTWDGHTLIGVLDPAAHMKDPEGVIFPVHQAGFLVEISDEPSAIEVMVAWDASQGGSFVLHPHYTAEYDEALGGDTLYYGYPSERFTEGKGCIRLPQADMAAGSWPMMIHSAMTDKEIDYTITVAIWNATGVVPDAMHGHRSDGDSPVDDHDVDPCRFLLPSDEDAGADHDHGAVV